MSVPIFSRDYSAHKLDESELLTNPIDLFKHWYAQAAEAGVTDVNAMTLATSTKEGHPFTRIVLFKGFDEEEKGFVFFTNFNSRKGRQLIHNPYASLNFYWPAPERQVNIRGKVVIVADKISDEYFSSRPRASQLGAWASNQSEVIPGRDFLENRFEEFKHKFDGQEVPRPSFWGGFNLVPDFIEFWQGRVGRLHDRFLYSRFNTDDWKVERLSP